MIRLRGTFLAALVFLSALSLRAEPQSPLNNSRPAQTAVSFYRWYLEALDHQSVPTDNLGGPIKQFTSLKLRNELKKMLRENDMDSDYFLKAQDFLPEWKSNIGASQTKIHGQSATTVISLGDRTPHRLNLSLVLQGGGWKIDSVRQAR